MRGVPISEAQIDEFFFRYLEGEKVIDIAKSIGVSKSALYDLLKDDKFIKRMENERHILQTQTRAMLMKDSTNYIKNLKEMANNSNDMRTKIRANELLLAYIIGSPKSSIEVEVKESNEETSIISNYLSSIKDSADDSE